MRNWAIAGWSRGLIVAEPRTRPLNGTTQAGPELRRVVRDYVRAHVWLHGQGKTAEALGVSRHTLWRFLERGHSGRAVPSAVLSSVGKSAQAIEAARLEIIIDLEGLRPDPALRVICVSASKRRSCCCAPRPWPPWRICPASGASPPPRSETG